MLLYLYIVVPHVGAATGCNISDVVSTIRGSGRLDYSCSHKDWSDKKGPEKLHWKESRILFEGVTGYDGD